MRLILASSSPRRQELLYQSGFEFEVRPARVQEVRRAGEKAEEFARRLAREKALEVARSAPADSLVLGADTVVVVNTEILGKPADAEDVARMLRMLSGVTHRVVTAVCLVKPPDHVRALSHEATLVTFRTLEEQEIREYISTGEPFDKAGAYAVQGIASKFVACIEGDHSNVVGLPVRLVKELLKPFLASD
jgi:septum formation protein